MTDKKEYMITGELDMSDTALKLCESGQLSITDKEGNPVGNVSGEVLLHMAIETIGELLKSMMTQFIENPRALAYFVHKTGLEKHVEKPETH